MNHSQLRHLIAELQKVTKHDSFVVIGSLSILGYAERNQVTVPDAMTYSMDLDFYPELDPESGFLVTKELGENSDFDLKYGYHADPVTPKLPSFPDGWQDRLLRLKEYATSATICFADPCDTAVSKYIRGEDRDRRWCRAVILADVLDPNIMAKRFAMVTRATQQEVNLARDRFKEDLIELSIELPNDVYFIDDSEPDTALYLDSEKGLIYFVTKDDDLYHYTRHLYNPENGEIGDEIEHQDYIYTDMSTFIKQFGVTLLEEEKSDNNDFDLSM